MPILSEKLGRGIMHHTYEHVSSAKTSPLMLLPGGGGDTGGILEMTCNKIYGI